VNVVDSSGWIEYLVDGPDAAFFREPLLDSGALVVPSISVFEVYRYVLRQRGRPDAMVVAAAMQQAKVVPLDESLAIEASEISVTLGLPMADSIIYATAVLHDATLWTQDADFEGLERVRYRRKGTS
jgi:predicted nucleic acid-binding protein